MMRADIYSKQNHALTVMLQVCAVNLMPQEDYTWQKRNVKSLKRQLPFSAIGSNSTGLLFALLSTTTYFTPLDISFRTTQNVGFEIELFIVDAE